MANPISYPPNIFEVIDNIGKTEVISLLTPQAQELSSNNPEITSIVQTEGLDMVNIIPTNKGFKTITIADDPTRENPTFLITYGDGEFQKASIIYHNYLDIDETEKKEATATFKRLLIDALKDYGYVFHFTLSHQERYENEYAIVIFESLGKKENYDLKIDIRKK